MRSAQEKRAAFRALHREGCFLLPNPWDAGSARLLENLGFQALASTSAGFAWTQARSDYGTTGDAAVAHLAQLTAAVDLPVNADFEAGYARTAEGVAENVTRAVQAGVAGLSIEDRDVGDPAALYPIDVAIERLRVARGAIDASGEDVVLVARSEGVLLGQSVSSTIARVVAFADAGVDCIYVPGVGMPGLSTPEDVSTLVRAVAPLPVNVLVATPDVSMDDLRDRGVRRISVGASLAMVGWDAVIDAGRRLLAGDFGGLGSKTSGRELNAIFSGVGGGS